MYQIHVTCGTHNIRGMTSDAIHSSTAVMIDALTSCLIESTGLASFGETQSKFWLAQVESSSGAKL